MCDLGTLEGRLEAKIANLSNDLVCLKLTVADLKAAMDKTITQSYVDMQINKRFDAHHTVNHRDRKKEEPKYCCEYKRRMANIGPLRPGAFYEICDNCVVATWRAKL